MRHSQFKMLKHLLVDEAKWIESWPSKEGILDTIRMFAHLPVKECGDVLPQLGLKLYGTKATERDMYIDICRTQESILLRLVLDMQKELSPLSIAPKYGKEHYRHIWLRPADKASYIGKQHSELYAWPHVALKETCTDQDGNRVVKEAWAEGRVLLATDEAFYIAKGKPSPLLPEERDGGLITEGWFGHIRTSAFRKNGKDFIMSSANSAFRYDPDEVCVMNIKEYDEWRA